MMKKNRQNLIAQLIEQNQISTQEELLEMLLDRTNELERLKECSARYNEKGARTEIVECPVISLSSTELRSDKDRSDGLPPKVERYIIQNGLYGRDKKLMVDLDELTGWLRSRLSAR